MIRLAVVLSVLLTAEHALAEMILDRSYDGMDYSENGYVVGATFLSNHSRGVRGTIRAAGNLYVTGVRAAVEPLFPGTADPNAFSFYLRTDESGPGAILGSLVLDSRVYDILPKTELGHVYSFENPIAVQGGQTYWLTLEPNQELPIVETRGLGYGFGWSQRRDVAPFTDTVGGQASASTNGGTIPTDWSVNENRFLAFQLIGVPEPSSLAIATLPLLAVVIRARSGRCNW